MVNPQANSQRPLSDGQAEGPLSVLGGECQCLLPVEAWQGHRVLVAVSGGADSVALLRTLDFLKQTHPGGPTLAVVHVNHGLRGDESDKEAAFVSALSNTLQAEFFEESIECGADVSENSLRELRYEAILKVASKIGARYVFTGHHQDDQIETILFRIFRGTGMTGLKGIPSIRVVDENITLVRPFLNVSRGAVELTLNCIGQSFCTDSSNLKQDYSRNFLRNSLLPEARSWFGMHIDASIIRLSEHAADAFELESMMVDQFFESSHFERAENCFTLKTNELLQQHPVVSRAVLIRAWTEMKWPVGDMTRQRWLEIDEVVRQSEVTPVVLNLPGDVRLEVDRRNVTFARRQC